MLVWEQQNDKDMLRHQQMGDGGTGNALVKHVHIDYTSTYTWYISLVYIKLSLRDVIRVSLPR